jgi:hypothetical protein
MAVTQADFDRRFQAALDHAGFDLNIKDAREILELVGGTIQAALSEQAPKVTSRRRRAASAEENGAAPNPVVVVRGLGRFTIRHRPAGWGRNPGTGEKIRIKASKRMKVLAPKPMRDSLGVK